MSRRGRAFAIIGVSGTIALALITFGGLVPVRSADDETARSTSDARTVSKAERTETIARAQVWRAPAIPVARASLGPAATAPNTVDCRFRISALGGTTPKFHCLLPSDVEVRVKYGPGDEIPAEAAATRLLAALGFGADR